MSATSAKRRVIKLANKINLSNFWIIASHRRMATSFVLLGMMVSFPASAMTQNTAQVPPRSESRQEQREKLVREAKKAIYSWCTKPGRSWRRSWPVEVTVTDKSASGANKKYISFAMSCPDGKLKLPLGYSAEDMMLFWAWSVVQREE